MDTQCVGEELIRLLKAVARRLTDDHETQKDLVQEMCAHFIKIKSARPGLTECWYINSCVFYARNCLVRGRSIDSLKRAGNRIFPIEDQRGHGNSEEKLFGADNIPSIEEIVSTRDIIFSLIPLLTPKQQEVFSLLERGFGVREVGRQLGISHPAVIKHRKHIAKLAYRIINGDYPNNGNDNGHSRLKLL